MTERLRPGVVVNERFTLVTPLGEGGFGEVWRARDLSLEREVALKFMRPELLRNESLRKRFDRESRALAAIKHPNVVQVIDRGEWQGRPFVILEYVQGGTLRDWLQQHGATPPLKEVRSLFAQICEGVGAAHDRGIVHRDLKPENVLLANTGRRTVVKVLDFGLARMNSGQSSVMMTVGTYEYMSPEQASEGSEELDARCDVFALGVMLVEMLTGRRLPGDGKKSWERVVDNGRGAEFVAALATTRPGVPALVWSAAKCALARRPSDRFADAEVLGEALSAAWAGVAGPVTEERASATAQRPTPRPQVAVAAPLASVVVMPSMATPRVAPPPPVVREAPRPPPVAAVTAPIAKTQVWEDAPGRSRGVPAWQKVTAGAVALVALGGGGYALLGRTTETPRTPSSPVVGAADAVTPVVATTPPPTQAAPRCDDGMVLVPGGTLPQGSSASAGATVPAFCLDRTEVTVAAFRACVSVGRCVAPDPSVDFEGVTAAMHRRYDPYCTLHPRFADSDKTPVNCVAFEQAQAYCQQRRARLPSETEWEFAAGGTEGRVYPWGDSPPTAERLNACGEGECPGGRMFAGQDGYAAPAPVGSFVAGNTPLGLQDMAGNVSEWVSDVFAPGDGTAGAQMHGVRGGGWSTTGAAAVLTTHRDGVLDGERRPEVGFRCASAAR